eukprot:scaffold21885_cov39-Tisochrysis_lutea.AAC.1
MNTMRHNDVSNKEGRKDYTTHPGQQAAPPLLQNSKCSLYYIACSGMLIIETLAKAGPSSLAIAKCREQILLGRIR